MKVYWKKQYIPVTDITPALVVINKFIHTCMCPVRYHGCCVTCTCQYINNHYDKGWVSESTKHALA